MWAGQDGNSGDPAGPFGPSVANKILSDSSVEKAAVKYQAYSSAMPFVANSFFAFSFLAKCIISGHFAMEKAMSALAPRADMCGAIVRVCFGPKEDIRQRGLRCPPSVRTRHQT